MDKKSIIIAESDPMSRLNLQTMIKDLGLDVIDSCSNDSNLLESCLKNKPDLLLIDVHLNGKSFNGTHFVYQLSQYTDIPAIFISGDNFEETIDQCVMQNSYGLIVKPVKDLSHLRTLLSFALKKHSLNFFSTVSI